MTSFEFKALTEVDFELMHQWLNCAHVAEKWDGPLSYAEVEKKYQTNIHSPYIFPFIVKYDGRPIGFIQSYQANLVGDGWWENEPSGTWGIDQFIGEENFLGKGFGSAFVREFTDELLLMPTISRIITDPSPDNLLAIRAYEKAGFKKLHIITTPDGPALLMEKLKI